MKKVLSFLVSCCLTMGAMAQLKVLSSGSVIFPNNVRIENPSGNIFLPYGTDIRFGCDSLWQTPKWSIEYHNGGLNFWKPNNSAGNQDYKLFIRDDGKVGIGCGNSPFNKLHVKGNVYIQSDNGHASLQIQTGATDPRLATTSTDIVMYGIGALSGYANLQCKKLYEKSDRDAKTNIQHLDKNSLDKICKLNGYSFNWKGDENGKRDVGLIAQEVEMIIPEIVKTADSTSGKLVSYIPVLFHI